MGEEATLTVDGRRLSGWTSVEVTRGIERLPNSFSFQASENSPALADARTVREGDPCTVRIGADVVITGYVDEVSPQMSAGSHDVRVTGRGKCQDLVDCAAIWKGCQVSGSNALEIARKLAEPYGVTVSLVGDGGPTVPQFNISVGDTPAAILELVTRHAGLLYYEGTDGNLILSVISADRAGSGVAEGVNVQAARFRRSMAQRFSRYECALLSVDTSGLFQDQEGLFYAVAEDPNVPRLRRMVIVAEGVQGGLELARRRARWEASRRAGRARSVTVTVDGWRDRAGRLWTPNTLVPVKLPTLELPSALYCLSEVTYRSGLDTGQVTEVTLMPQESFAVEPIMLQPVLPGLV
jgi:prophage tail gpP-like protein